MIDVSYPGTAGRADQRQWGPMWPTDRSDEMVPLVVRGVSFGPGVRREIHDLVELLIEASLERGYLRHLIAGSCFSYANRAIKRSDGSLSNTPSNHSAGLAVDINAVENVYGSHRWAIPTAMARLWNRYGFRWGGDYPNTKDAMHFEFMGTPATARQVTLKAQEELMRDTRLDDFVEGMAAYWDQSKTGDAGPPNDRRPVFFKRGWEAARRGALNPAGGSGGSASHKHRLTDIQRHRHRQGPTVEAEVAP